MKAKTQAELTPREIEVVRLIWEEFSTKEIAVKLSISPRTASGSSLEYRCNASCQIDYWANQIRTQS